MRMSWNPLVALLELAFEARATEATTLSALV